MPEFELPWLAGYEGSKPVRVGNGAWDQVQLDVYGELLNALHLYRERLGDLHPEIQAFVGDLADTAARRWHEPGVLRRARVRLRLQRAVRAVPGDGQPDPRDGRSHRRQGRPGRRSDRPQPEGRAGRLDPHDRRRRARDRPACARLMPGGQFASERRRRARSRVAPATPRTRRRTRPA